MQRASEAFRHGKTEQEERLAQAFADMKIAAKRDMVYCFVCETVFKNTAPSQYPRSCQNCGLVFSEPDQYCMPDFVLENQELATHGVVFIDGKQVHQKTHKRIAKDKRQRLMLASNYWKVFVVYNDLIDNAEQTWLRALAYSMYEATRSRAHYDSLVKGEKELVGIN